MPFIQLLRRVLFYLSALASLLLTAWSAGALIYDGPGKPVEALNLGLAAVWLSSVIILATRAQFQITLPGKKRPLSIGSESRKPSRKTPVKWPAVLILSCLPVYVYWLSIRPSNDRDWQAEFAQTGYVDVQGDNLIFHQLRNFDYQNDGSATGKVTDSWESRTHTLSKLNGIDLHFDAFGGKLMAHPMLSFDFGDEGHVLLSIETRREKHESFSALGGIYKMFELQYIFGDEADFIRVRTNIRDEPCYIYRTTATAAEARELLLDCIASQNALKKQPYWYNAVTTNCTTSYRAQTPSENRHPFDWRMLVNGQLDRMLYEKGVLETGGLSFDDLRKQALINPVAQKHTEAEGFSAAIRKGRAGFEKTE